jgi:hypothetical protein
MEYRKIFYVCRESNPAPPDRRQLERSYAAKYFRSAFFRRVLRIVGWKRGEGTEPENIAK